MNSELPESDASFFELKQAQGQPLQPKKMPQAAIATLAHLPEPANRRHTTTEPQDPGSRREFIEKRNVDRAYETLAENVYDALSPEKDVRKREKKVATAMKGIQGYMDALSNHELGTFLADTFGAITHIAADNVHVELSTDGADTVDTVVAEKMTFSVGSQEESKRLNNVLQALLVTPNGSYIVESDGNTVSVDGLDEHAIRALARVVEATEMYDKKVAREKEDRDENQSKQQRIIRRTFTAPAKRSLVRLEKEGHTFPSDEKAQWERKDHAYQKLGLEASYYGDDTSIPLVNSSADNAQEMNSFDNRTMFKHSHLLITEAAPALQGMRDIMNGCIRELPFRSQGNPEQNPDKDSRLLVEQDIELKRDPVDPGEEHHGPQLSRIPTRGEKTLDQARKLIESSSNAPVQTILKLIEAAPRGVVDLALKLGPLAVPAIRSGKHLLEDRRAWRDQKEDAATAQEERDRILQNERVRRMLKTAYRYRRKQQ